MDDWPEKEIVNEMLLNEIPFDHIIDFMIESEDDVSEFTCGHDRQLGNYLFISP